MCDCHYYFHCGDEHPIHNLHEIVSVRSMDKSPAVYSVRFRSGLH